MDDELGLAGGTDRGHFRAIHASNYRFRRAP